MNRNKNLLLKIKNQYLFCILPLIMNHGISLNLFKQSL